MSNPTISEPLPLSDGDVLRRVKWFLVSQRRRLETEPSEIISAVFDEVRVDDCTEAILAEIDGEIVGVATVKSRVGDINSPIRLDAVVVAYDYRNKDYHIGSRLTKKAVEFLNNDARGVIHCQIVSPDMASILDRILDQLPPDQKARWKLDRDY